MQVTEVRIALKAEERLKAFATITFDNCFVVRHIRIVKTDTGLIVSMPSRKMPDNTHKDVAHPINQEFRAHLEKAVLKAFDEKVALMKTPNK